MLSTFLQPSRLVYLPHEYNVYQCVLCGEPFGWSPLSQRDQTPGGIRKLLWKSWQAVGWKQLLWVGPTFHGVREPWRVSEPFLLQGMYSSTLYETKSSCIVKP